MPLFGRKELNKESCKFVDIKNWLLGKGNRGMESGRAGYRSRYFCLVSFRDVSQRYSYDQEAWPMSQYTGPFQEDL